MRVQKKHILSCCAVILALCLTAGGYWVGKQTSAPAGDVVQAVEQILKEQHADPNPVMSAIKVMRRVVDPVSDSPFFIFPTRTVSWAAIAPDLAESFGETVQELTIEVLGTFPIAGSPPEDHFADIQYDDEQITFPEPGEYYLWTSIGALKILILESEKPSQESLLAVFAFIAKNIVHTRSDFDLCRPNINEYSYKRPDKMLKKMFASDQPLGLHCGQAMLFLHHVLDRLGYECLKVSLESQSGSGHIALEARPPEGDWIFLDPDFGYLITDPAGNPLSIKTISQALYTENTEPLGVLDLVGKGWLKPMYNLRSDYMPDFTWTPDKMLPGSQDTSTYLKTLAELASKQIVIYELNDILWEKVMAKGRPK